MAKTKSPQQAVSASHLDRLLEETDFYGVVHVTHADRVLYSRARGFADRARGVPNTPRAGWRWTAVLAPRWAVPAICSLPP